MLKVFLRQYKPPTGPSKFLRGITATKTDKKGPKVEIICIMWIQIHLNHFMSLC